MVETPKNRRSIPQKYMIPLSTSTPIKHANLESDNNTSSDETPTTIIECKQHNYRIENYVSLRLRLDEIRLKIQQEAAAQCNDDKENLSASKDFFLNIQSELVETCDQLLAQCRSQDQCARDQQNQTENMYKTHLDELGDEVMELRDENGKLRQKLTLIDSKITEVLNENKYLRWESEQFAQTNDSLQRQIDEKSLTINELQAEIQCLKSNQSEINRIHASKLQSLIQANKHEEKKKLNAIRREYELKLNNSTGDPLKTTEKLIEDNRLLYKKLVEARHQLNKHHNESNNDSTATINDRQSNVVRFGTIERISSDGQVFQQSIAEWEEKFGTLRREYELEKQQRKNVTKLLVEMSKDMKTLLSQKTQS